MDAGTAVANELHYSTCYTPALVEGNYREDPAGPAARLAEPVPRDDMPAVSGAAGGRGLATGRGARRPPRGLLSFVLDNKHNVVTALQRRDFRTRFSKDSPGFTPGPETVPLKGKQGKPGL
ncbi:hypothetical protein EYF80_035677 [Liparis tanakae]|uniref:Uncharacterized protein n=1 Tax=Liparis tanakae TaxID=230148 RepID=A0A4Z2GKK4_9TELE|nr:hypothetical protein EYF80_035677 [Liparis tanakae]